ncbi:MAG: aspartyl protease family protein [Gemmatimonadaceae bacterium]
MGFALSMTGSSIRRWATMFACMACSALAVAAQSAEPIAVIHFDQYPSGDNLLTVHASIHGHAGTFLFDTGEGVSMISPALARAIGCKPWAQVTGFRMRGDRVDTPRCDDIAFDVEGRPLTAPSVLVFDLMKFFPPNAPVLDGSLGLDLFADRAITFELAEKALIVESPQSLASRVAHATQVPIRLVRDAEGLALSVDVGVATPNGTAWMVLDSGSGIIFVSKAIASGLDLDPESRAVQPIRFTIAGAVPVEGRARVEDDMSMDGISASRFSRNGT